MRMTFFSALLTVLIAVFISVLPTTAQADHYDTVSGATPYVKNNVDVSAYVLHQIETDLDDGGSFSKTAYSISANYKLQNNGPIGIGLGVDYKMLDYSFDGPTFAGIEPWDKAHFLDIGASINYRLRDAWTLWVRPSVGLAMEDGAELPDSLIYGGILAVSRRFGPDIRAGIGTRVSFGLEDTKVIPIILLSWDITERISLSNPRPQPPASPAGLELSYDVPGNWEVAVGTAYRSNRFRMDDTGIAPDGIAENKEVPAWIRASKTIHGNTEITLFAGMTLWGKLIMKDRDGDKVSTDEYESAPIISLHISSMF